MTLEVNIFWHWSPTYIKAIPNLVVLARLFHKVYFCLFLFFIWPLVIGQFFLLADSSGSSLNLPMVDLEKLWSTDDTVMVKMASTIVNETGEEQMKINNCKNI